MFVARDDELARLDRVLSEVVDGTGQVCFVVGDAGTGKTALVGEFARRAQARNDDLIVAAAQSDAQTGAGDAYLPFRDLLGQLAGDVKAKLATGGITAEGASRLTRFLGVSGEAIVELGPDLVGAFLPGAGLATRAAAYVARKTGHLERLEELAESRDIEHGPGRGTTDQLHIYEQYTNVITHLAGRQPLLLILDDLHWVDPASVGLLFHLGRSIPDSRVLVLGTYRPEEVALGRNGERHPLEKVLNEFKRYFGEIAIDLRDTSASSKRALVDLIADSEPNLLGPEFRRALFERTGGHPLFTVELLRSLQERGELTKDAHGCWCEVGSIDWGGLPARVEGVIEERIGRLDGELLGALTVASVEGDKFTAEVVASVRNVEPRRLVGQLGRELEDRHRLVRSRGLHRLADGSRLSLFGFSHNLIQRYLYLGLTEAERAYLHEDVGNALEALCGDHADEFLVQLARHFSEAGIADKAAAYLGRAGKLSLARYANDEAADYLAKALTLTPASDSLARWDLLGAHEEACGLLGDRQSQAEDLESMRRIAEELDDDRLRSEACLRKSVHARTGGDFEAARLAAEAATRFASSIRDIGREARAGVEWGVALSDLGQVEEAASRLEYALALAEGAGLHRVQAMALNRLATIHHERGEFADASRLFGEARRIRQRLNDLLGQAMAVNGLGIVAAKQGNLGEARMCFGEAVELLRRVGDRRREGIVLHNIGEAATETHDYLVARARFREALRISRLTENRPGECLTLNSLGNIAVRLGLLGEAAECLEQSSKLSEEIGQQVYIGDALVGLAMLSLAKGTFGEAFQFSRTAAEIGRTVAEPILEGTALDLVGRSLEATADWDAAAEAYGEAVAVRKRAGLHNGPMESVAGLARVALGRGDIAGGLVETERIVEHLDDGDLIGTEDPGAVYLTAYRVLEAAGDGRSASMLAQGYRYMIDQAARIDDPDLKRSFLEEVPTNVALTKLMLGDRPNTGDTLSA